jgi:hypothetical protein
MFALQCPRCNAEQDVEYGEESFTCWQCQREDSFDRTLGGEAGCFVRYEWPVHQVYSRASAESSVDAASIVAQSSLSLVVQAIIGRPSRIPQNTVPWGTVGLARRFQGPGD